MTVLAGELYNRLRNRESLGRTTSGGCFEPGQVAGKWRVEGIRRRSKSALFSLWTFPRIEAQDYNLGSVRDDVR